MAKQNLPIIIADNERSAIAGLAMLARGTGAALVYIEDMPGRPGEMRVMTAYARGHEHRASEVDALIKEATDRGGFAIVDPALLTKRGAA